MKQRAVMRLGGDFAELLGSAHSFESFNTELLARYVCSGDFAGNSSLGQFADITKQADLYFDDGPFAFPVTLTDTPGTNDPFLIRDEITRRSLESADLYIVVLTARQPLSEADVNLMRLMHGLNSERIIVFVNRVDDFADVGYDLAEVLMYVEKKLEANFPGARIPVVAGSAAWANGALKGDGDSLQPPDAASLARLPCGHRPRAPARFDARCAARCRQSRAAAERPLCCFGPSHNVSGRGRLHGLQSRGAHPDADGPLVRRHGERQRQGRQLRTGVFARPIVGSARGRRAPGARARNGRAQRGRPPTWSARQRTSRSSSPRSSPRR